MGTQNPVKKRDVGIAGTVILLSQLLTSHQSAQSISDEIKEFRAEFHKSQISLEQNFARKSDLQAILNKIDDLSDQIRKLDEGYTSSLDAFEYEDFFLPKSLDSAAFIRDY